jgi:tRNA pseudouridine38-40 synthase
MARYRLVIEYDGRPFCGWQRQANQLSVQQVVEEAIERFSGEKVVIQAAGRTDAGVHARGQVVSFDLVQARDPFRIGQALNFHTKPHPVAIVAVEAVPDTFEARFSATARRYDYLILNRRGRPALEAGKVWHVPKPLDSAAMADAAGRILGFHDFTTFRAAECQARSPLRTLDEFTVTRDGELIRIGAKARSFLHSQVRSMVGSLKLVGEGRWSPEDFRAALDAQDRARCGPLAPPDGLYFMAVDYDSGTA